MKQRENEVQGLSANSPASQARANVSSEDHRYREGHEVEAVTNGEVMEPRGQPSQQATFRRLSWQPVLYLVVLGCVCVLLAPLTSLWWIVPVSGAVGPVMLNLLDKSGLLRDRHVRKKVRERELLEALVEQGELTSTMAAMQTSLTVSEAARMLEDLTTNGHLEHKTENGTTAYRLKGRDLGELPDRTSTSASLLEPVVVPQPNEPLSERELEVLVLLSSGRTNAEISRDLFVALGTVKSHLNNIYRKLGVRNRAEALARVRDLNLR